MTFSCRGLAVTIITAFTAACSADGAASQDGDASAEQRLADSGDTAAAVSISSMRDAGAEVDARTVDAANVQTAASDDASINSTATPSDDAGVADAGRAEPPPIPTFGAAEGIIVGNFNNGDPAFDGILDQGTADAATTALYLSVAEDILLGKNWRCSARLDSVTIHGPSDGAFAEDGSEATVAVLGRNDDESSWHLIAQKPMGTQDPAVAVAFGPDDLESAPAYTMHALGFPKTEGSTTSLRIAEAEMSATCMQPVDTIEWETSEWECEAECELAENAGERSRNVGCLRNGQDEANDAFCSGEKPEAEGGACVLSCGFNLVFLGYRAFTYENGSGWLHEGRADRRAGPLPRAATFGDSPDAIEGSPCSLETTTASTYFTGIGCKNPDTGSDQEYCAFRCE